MKTLTKLIGFALVAWIVAEAIAYAYRRGVNDTVNAAVRKLLERPDWALTVASASVLRDIRQHRESEGRETSAVDEAWEGAVR